MKNLVKLCEFTTLREHHCLGFDPFKRGKDELFAIHKEDRIFIYENRCPHEPVTLEFRKNQFLSKDKSQIICFAHGARFDVQSGRCIHGPCLGEKLKKVPYQLLNGHVYVKNTRKTKERP